MLYNCLKSLVFNNDLYRSILTTVTFKADLIVWTFNSVFAGAI